MIQLCKKVALTQPCHSEGVLPQKDDRGISPRYYAAHIATQIPRRVFEQSSHCFKPLGSVNAKALPLRGGPWVWSRPPDYFFLAGAFLAGIFLATGMSFTPFLLRLMVCSTSGFGCLLPGPSLRNQAIKKRNKYRRRCQPFAPLFLPNWYRKAKTRNARWLAPDASVLSLARSGREVRRIPVRCARR